MWELFFIFFKLGLFTFGGGYAMIPNIKQVVIEKKKWLTEDEILEIIAIAESTPGPIAINMATYIGNKQKGFWGSVLATIGVVLPSLFIIFAISLFFESFIQNKYVAYAFVGIKCAVAFLITKTGIEMLIKMKKNFLNIFLFLLAFVSIILLDIFAVNFSAIFFILFGGILSLIIFSITNSKNKKMVKQTTNTNEEELENIETCEDKNDIKIKKKNIRNRGEEK